jgi:RNA polymerase sigma factor (sigma-70 family)
VTESQVRSPEQLYQHSWPGLVRLGRLLTGSQQLGEDLAQEAWPGLLRRSERVESPEAYLRRSIVNLAITSRRRALRERLHLTALRRLDEVVPPEPDDLWPLIVKLPARQRAVLVLRYYEDLSEAQIASVLDCPVGTVKSLASRALAALRSEVPR